MRLFKLVATKWKSWHITNDVKAGRVLRGRQLGGMGADTEPIPELSYRVYRAATDTWENPVKIEEVKP